MPASFVEIGAFVTDFILGPGTLIESVGIPGTIAINTAIGAATGPGCDIEIAGRGMD